MKKIIMADRAGFCFGVKRAVNAIEDALESQNQMDKGEAWSIGMPIHNPQEVARLGAKGLRVAQDAGEVPDGAKILIRAHGESRAVMKSLRDRGMKVIDATCPFVRRAQEHASELSSEGYHVVLLGNARHPEIRAIMGYVDGPIDVVANAEEAANVLKDRGSKLPRVALISQTTQQEEFLAEVAFVLVPRAEELHVCNTVCKATVERQDAVRRLADKVDGIVLIGGRESANTAKLRDIAKANGMDVLWIENINEVGDPEGISGEVSFPDLNASRRWLEEKTRIGIAAGASTPQWLITEICNKIARM